MTSTNMMYTSHGESLSRQASHPWHISARTAALMPAFVRRLQEAFQQPRASPLGRRRRRPIWVMVSIRRDDGMRRLL